MANYATLKAAIAAAIKQNGNNEITGDLLQQQLLAMVNSLGVGYQYVGIATPSTNPGTPDQNVFYIASTAGTYTNFGGLVLDYGEISILKYNGAWSKDSTGAASLGMVNQLSSQFSISNVTFTPTSVVFNFGRVWMFSAKDKTWKSTDAITSSFTFNSNSSGTQFLVWSADNTISIKSESAVLSDDILLLQYSFGIGICGGELYQQYLDEKFSQIYSASNIRFTENSVIFEKGKVWRIWQKYREFKSTDEISDTFEFNPAQPTAQFLVWATDGSVSIKTINNVSSDDILLLQYSIGIGICGGVLYDQYINSRYENEKMFFVYGNKPYVKTTYVQGCIDGSTGNLYVSPYAGNNVYGVTTDYILVHKGDIIILNDSLFSFYIAKYNSDSDKTYKGLVGKRQILRKWVSDFYGYVRITLLFPSISNKDESLWSDWSHFVQIIPSFVPDNILYYGYDYEIKKKYINLFLSSSLLRQGGIYWTTGYDAPLSGTSLYYCKSPYLFVSGKTKISLVNSLTTGMAVMVYYYDAKRNYKGCGNGNTPVFYTSNFEIEWTGYVRIALTTEEQPSGNYNLTPNDAEFVIVDKCYDLADRNDDFANAEFSDLDIPVIPDQNSDGASILNLNDCQASDIYDIYDALITASNGYITKTVLGKDQSGEYDIWKLTLRNSTSKAPVKVLIEAQMHGRPYDSITASFSIFTLCKMLVERDGKTAKYLRENVDFEIIPIVNPWGVDNMKYGNSRDIQINLNFDVNFIPNISTTAHGGTPVYSGASAFSEKETQYIRDLIQKNPDADLFIDMHSYSTSYVKATYLPSDWDWNNMLYGFIKVMENTAKKYAGTVNRFIVPTSADLPGGWSVDYSNLVCGIPALTLEASARQQDGVNYASDALTSNLCNVVGIIKYVTQQKLKNILRRTNLLWEEKYHLQ